jgi:hypothetical protein
MLGIEMNENRRYDTELQAARRRANFSVRPTDWIRTVGRLAARHRLVKPDKKDGT